MARFKDADWNLPVNSSGNIGHVDGGSAHLAVLMDIRDELKKLNALLYCQNFVQIPTTLKSIDTKVTKPKRKKS